MPLWYEVKHLMSMSGSYSVKTNRGKGEKKKKKKIRRSKKGTKVILFLNVKGSDSDQGTEIVGVI